MRKRSVDAIIRKIEAQQKRIAVERDRLDDLISTAQDILDGCQEADDHMTAARDALSRMV